MGILRFRFNRDGDLPNDVAERTAVVSLEGVPWTCRVERHNNELRIVRKVADSGYLHVPWRSSQYGELLLSTATVVERGEPYDLVVELARGTIHRVATQLAEWQLSGLQDTGDVSDRLARAKGDFARAVAGSGEPEERDALARTALDTALDASELLMARYTAQVIAMRRQEPARIPTWLGCNLGVQSPGDAAARLFTTAFNAAVVPFSWREVEPSVGDFDWLESDRQLEWCAQQGIRVCGGPLLSLESLDLPDWLYLWEDRPDDVAGYIREHITRVVKRYKGRVHLWHCAAHVNSGQALAWNDEDRLQITANAVEWLRSVDAQTPLIVSVDQPWGEYMARRETDLAPLYYADALLRADLGITGVGLELNFGYAPYGMSARDRLAISRKLDHWSMLGVPLAVFLTVPSGSGPDPGAKGERTSVVNAPVDPRWQQRTAEALMSMLMSKRFVQIIVWNQWSDQVPHRYPHGGLVDRNDTPKPALEMFQSLRRTLLG